jgi:glycosyltransferase involved in cell wall biosynthesis
MKIAYLSRNDGTDYRGAKMCNSLVKLGHNVVNVGWDRTPEKNKELCLVPEVKLRILRRPGVFEQNSLEGWGDYYPHVLRSLYEEKPDAVQAVNEETAALVLPFKRTLYRWLILDVYDSVTANFYRARWMDLAARICRWLGNTGADCIIETAPELQAMLGKFAKKSIIIENAPFDPGNEIAARVPTVGPIRLGLGGGLTKRRMGLDVLVAALDLLPQGSVIVEASGWLGDDYAKDVFAKHPAVSYRWLPNAPAFLEVAGRCDALLYLRSDSSESQYVASVRPNRLFEALAVGRPIIVNPGLAIGRWIEEEKLGMVLPRFDAASLASAIASLKERRAALPEQARHMRRIFLAGHVWPVMERRLGELYGRLEKRTVHPRTAAFSQPRGKLDEVCIRPTQT